MNNHKLISTEHHLGINLPLQGRIADQSGAVLIISLIMLLLLMLIGTTSMQSTSLEEKMAGNSRDQNLAFQSAEAALRAGEARIETLYALKMAGALPGAFCNGTAGLFKKDDLGCLEPPQPEEATTWTDNTKSITYNTGSTLVATQPRYFITYVSPYNPIPPGAPIVFTITARGTGGQNNTQVILRSYYGGDINFQP